MSSGFHPIYSTARWLARGIAEPTLNLAYNAGLYRMLSTWYGGCGVIFSLHRVVDHGQLALNPGYKLRAAILDYILVMVRRLGWEIVSIDDMHRHLTAHNDSQDEQRRKRHRLACFTLDDGYADNLIVALPIFRKHQAPLAVFIATDIVDRELFYWWDANEELVLKNERIELPHVDDSGSTLLWARTLAEKIVTYQTLNQLCHKMGEALFPSLQQLYERHGINWEGNLDRDALTVAQVGELALDPLVTVGSHSISHRRLSRMVDEEVHFEMEEGRRRLEKWAAVEIRHFAYPFGRQEACGLREFAIAKKIGFKMAFTTRQGNIFPEHHNYLQCLPRRSIPVNILRLRNILYGVQTIRKQESRFQTD